MKTRKLTSKSKALMNANANHRAFSTAIQFEEFLRQNSTATEREFRLVVTEKGQDALTILCHPLGRDGQTYDGYVMRFNVEPKKAIDNLMKYLRQETITEQLHKLGVMRPASASGKGRTVASEGREKHVRGGCIDRTRKKDGPCCYPVGTCDDCQIP